MRRVAAFDFDGTVSRRDTLVPFVARFAGVGRSAAGLFGAGWDALVRQTLAARDRDAVKEQMIRRLLTGRDARDLDRAAGAYAARLIDRALRPDMVEEIRRHVAAGHETLFVSASLANYLRPIARYLGMTDVIAVDLDVSDGVLTGSMVHPNVRAAEKAVRLRRWLGAPTDGPLEGVELWAYGNSSGDHELLELGDHAYWLGKPGACPVGAVPYSPAVGFS
jgi:phosphatidylglycerophosphatase C